MSMSAIITAHANVQSADKAMLAGKAVLAQRKQELRAARFEQADAFSVRRAEARVLLQQGRVNKLEAELKAAQREYRKVESEVRVSRIK